MCQGRAGKQDQKDGNRRKKRRGPDKGHITLGGLKKIQKFMRRKAKNKMRKRLREMNLPMGRKLGKKGKGPLAP